MFFLYTLLGCLIYFLAFFPALVQILRGRGLWIERLGLRLPRHSADIWLHASSVGEVRLLFPLIAYLRSQKPQMEIHLSAFTWSGYDAAQKIYEKDKKISVSCLPLDVFFCMRRLTRRLRPRLLILTEGEHWYCLLREAKKQKIPAVLANGRISKKSFTYFRLFPYLSRHFLSHYAHFFFKSEQDRKRYLTLLPDHKKSMFIGDMKFDAPLTARSPSQVTEMRRQLCLTKKDFLWLCVSTRPPNEEKILADTFLLLREIYQNLRLVIAPRHLNRIPIVKKILEDKGLAFSLYSSKKRKSGCILVDQIGVLQNFFPAANLAFVGGTMADTGGHNILEPVWAGTPVIFGPDTRNILDSAEYVVKKNYGSQFQSPQELFNLVKETISGRKKFQIKKTLDAKASVSRKIGSYLLKKYFRRPYKKNLSA